MDGTDGMVLWVLGGVGVTLIYSAIKHKSPLSVLTNHLSGSSATDAGTADATASAAPASYTSSGVPYSVGMAPDGTQYVYDGNGNPLSVLPANYSNSPSTYIPPEVTSV